MRLLGLGAFHRDSAAALVVDGVPLAAAQEERFTKKLRDPSFPRRAARWCLEQAQVAVAELDGVVFYEKPIRKFERSLLTQLQAFPRSAKTFSRGMFSWLGDRLWTKNRIEEELSVERQRIFFVEHALAHAASAYYCSGFDEAAVLILDDVGEWTTTWLGRAQGKTLSKMGEVLFPHSLGLFGSAITQFLGFEPGADEGLVEALAALGEPRFQGALQGLVHSEAGRAYRLEAQRFRFAFDHEQLFDNELFAELGPPRPPGGLLRASSSDLRDADVAASWQAVLEQVVLQLVRDLKAQTGSTRLCLGGMLAWNRALVARVAADGPFTEIYVPPDPDEAGAALGAALYLAGLNGDEPRKSAGRPWVFGEPLDERKGESAQQFSSAAEAQADLLRRLLAGEKLGWVSGALDFGARALHHRLALCRVDGSGSREQLLTALQPGEEWRPCRVALPAELLDQFLECPAALKPALANAHGLVRARSEQRERFAPVERADGRLWCQSVVRERDPDLHNLLMDLGSSSGLPAALLTDLALRGQPLVRNELDALELFQRSKLDALFCGQRLYLRG